jgi:hypothetical protein
LLELRAVAFLDGGEVAFVEEADADAFGLYLVEDDVLGWVADFSDYGWALKFSTLYAEETNIDLIDRVRALISQLV